MATLVATLLRTAAIVPLLIAGVGALVWAYPRLREGWVLKRVTPVSAGELESGVPSASVDVGDYVALEGRAVPLIEKRVSVADVTDAGLVGVTVAETFDSQSIGPWQRDRWLPSGGAIEWVPMAVADDTGKFEVEPPKAGSAYDTWTRFAGAFAFDAEHVGPNGNHVMETVLANPESDDPATDASSGGQVAADGGRRRYRRSALLPDESVYVVGTLTERFGNHFVTGQENTDAFRMTTGDPPSATEPLVRAGGAALFALAAWAGAVYLALPLV